MKGSSWRIATSLAKLCVANLPVHWHASHNLQKSMTFLYIVGHWYLASKIFLCVILVTKVASYCSFMQLLHHLLRLCDSQTPLQYDVLSHSIQNIILHYKRLNPLG
jgi:hypothetical protein